MLKENTRLGCYLVVCSWTFLIFGEYANSATITISVIPLLLYFVGRLELDFNLDSNISAEMPHTPAPCSSRSTRTRRRVRHEEGSSDEDSSPTSVVPNSVGPMSARSQRASKTAALTKMTTASRAPTIDEDDEEEESSGVTSDEGSDGSD